jgi:antitoxin component of RelBE/YafQ-DinJ toxin-antitoxin module
MAREHRVEARLNEKEYQLLQKYAEKLGITKSEAMRRLIQQLLERTET